MLVQSSTSLVTNTALPATDLVPSRTSATNPAARTHRPMKRNTKRNIFPTSPPRSVSRSRLLRGAAAFNRRDPKCSLWDPPGQAFRDKIEGSPSGAHAALEKAGASLQKTPAPEGWPSGLRRTLGKRVYVKAYRGFESHSLRQSFRAKNSPHTCGT